MELIANELVERHPRLVEPEPAQDRRVVVTRLAETVAVEQVAGKFGEAARIQQDRSVLQWFLPRYSPQIGMVPPELPRQRPKPRHSGRYSTRSRRSSGSYTCAISAKSRTAWPIDRSS